MGRKKTRKSNSGPTTMTYKFVEDDINVAPVNEDVDKSDDSSTAKKKADELQSCTCTLCGYVFKNKYRLEAHKLTHKEKTEKCNVCDMVFKTPAQLKRHKQNIHMDPSLRPHGCHMCTLRFMNKSHLKSHIKTHTGERDVTCGLCFQAFYSKCDLVRHMKGRHLNIRSFACNFCSKGFFRKSYLKLHIESVHMSEGVQGEDRLARIFACRYCRKIFFNKTSCYEHERTHTTAEELRFLCTFCGKTYSRASTLKKHVEKHTSKPKIKCPLCDRRFYHGSSFNRHMHIHTRTDPDVCQVCGKSYTNKDAFRRHLRRHVERGDIEAIPVPQKDIPNVTKMQVLISKGANLDELLEKCKVEVVELGGKNNSKFTNAKDQRLNMMIDEIKAMKPRWMLNIDEVNHSFSFSRIKGENSEVTSEAWNLAEANAELQVFNIETMGYINNKLYSVISNDFKSIVKDSSVSDIDQNEVIDDSRIVQDAVRFNLKTSLCAEDTTHLLGANIFIPKDVNTELFSTVTEIDIPIYVEGIPEIKNEFLALDTCHNVCDVFFHVRVIDMSQSVYELNLALDHNLSQVLHPLQIACRKLNHAHKENMERGFNNIEVHKYAIYSHIHSTENLQDFREFECKVVEWTDEEIQVKICNILNKNKKTKVYGLHNLLNITENSEELDNIIPEMPIARKKTIYVSEILNTDANTKLCPEEWDDQELIESNKFMDTDANSSFCQEELDDTSHGDQDNIESPDIDMFIYEDMVDEMDFESHEEPEVKPDLPDLPLMQPRVLLDRIKIEPESSETTTLSHYYHEENNRTKNKRRSKRKRQMNVTSASEEFVEMKPRKKKRRKTKKVRKSASRVKHKDYKVKHKDHKVKYKDHKVKEKDHKVKDKDHKVKDKDDEMKDSTYPINYNPNIRLIETEFLCHHCNRLCRSKGILRTHIQTMHLLTVSCSCHDCGRAFINKSRLEAHILSVHLRVRNFQCEHCPWAFFSHADLVRHIRKHTGSRPFMCDLCSKTFNRKNQLKNHMVVHTGEKNFVCYMCGHKYGTRSTLHSHLKRHEAGLEVRAYRGRKYEIDSFTPPKRGDPIACDKCGKELATVHSLRRHIALVHIQPKKAPRAVLGRPWKCQIPDCIHTFTHKTSMQRHMHRVHMSEVEPRKSPCPVCGKRLLNEACVLRHMIVKHPENCDDVEAMQAAYKKSLTRQIPCPICRRMFLREKGMKKHMEEKHMYKSDTEDQAYEPSLPPAPIQHMYEASDDKPNLLLL